MKQIAARKFKAAIDLEPALAAKADGILIRCSHLI